jgi:D-beta-D-heptose 7-phosphate kinase/D-beta-D-heptose 1-phosphate adenosyltransferase
MLPRSGFSDVQIAALGDFMLDQYILGEATRISAECPVPVVSIRGRRSSPGGAGHVAASVAGLGGRVSVLGTIGADAEGAELRELLHRAGVTRLELEIVEGATTTTKTRVLAGNSQQMIRLDDDGNPAALAASTEDLSEHITAALAVANAVVISDYNKGTITADLAEFIVHEARSRGLPCIVDSKRKELSCFRGATVLTPNIDEVSRVVGRELRDVREIETAARQLRAELGINYMLVTRSSQGAMLAGADGIQHFPAKAREVADVTGAGDTVVATLAVALASGWLMTDACELAMVAAGLAVVHTGTYVVTNDELQSAWEGRSPKISDWTEARRRMRLANTAGKRTVFTNGCFDILHAGHLSCLERARRLGDLLCVGLNSDDSVRRLKGCSRPVIPQDQRAMLLAGLSCVDLVVVFDEDTPEQLVRHLAPDVLVKGADYSDREVAGSEFVRERGGQVVLLPLVPGLSTSNVLNGIQPIGHQKSGCQIPSNHP